MKTIDITELDPSNFNWLREGKKSKETELQKGRVYLEPGQQAPEGVQVQTGPRGGQFYDESPSQSTADSGAGDVPISEARTALGFVEDNPLTNMEREGKTEGPRYDDVKAYVLGNKRMQTGRYDSVDVPVASLKDLSGARGEESLTGEALEGALESRRKIAESIRQSGFDSEQRPAINVEPDGTVQVYEGNQRIAAAAEVGLETIPIEVRYFGGSERLEGVFDPATISQSTADETDPITIQPEGSTSPENKALIDNLKEIGEINPENPDEMIIDNVKVGPIKVWNDRVNLTSLTSLDPRSGAGSKALKRITDLADKHGVTLEDAAVPFRGADGEMIPKDKLRAFYMRNGYQFPYPNDPDRMVRFPQSNEPIRINIGGDDDWTSVPRDQEGEEDTYWDDSGTSFSIR